MTRHKFQGVIAAAAVAALAGGVAHAQTVSVNSNTKFQTILGWHATLHDSYLPERQRDMVVEMLVDLGINSYRVHPLRREWEDVVNDNGNPFVTNPDAFITTGYDHVTTNWILPLKEKLEASGKRLSLTVEPSFYPNSIAGDIPEWMYRSPGEYSEWALESLRYFKDKWGIEVDYYGITNEAGYSNRMDPQTVLPTMIKYLGPRLQKEGFNTKIQYASFQGVDKARIAMENLQNDAKLWEHIGLVTYHLYTGNTAGERRRVKNVADKYGIPTAQTEYTDADIDDFYLDLVEGNVSQWSQYTATYYGNGTAGGSYVKSNTNLTSLTLQDYYWQFYQIMHYVNEGDVRVSASSTHSDVRTVAFQKPDGSLTTVLISGGTTRTVTLAGLTPGATYGVSQSTGTNPMQEKGLQMADETGRLTVTIDANSVLTVYPYAGSNQAPKLTQWGASDRFLRTTDAGSTMLSALATDAELDAINFGWTLKQAPAGANVSFANPNAPSTAASGLTVPGEYVFEVAATDANGATTTKEVVLMVYDRNNAPYWHPEELTTRGPATVTLPATSLQISAFAGDIESDPITYQWSIVSQPDGASATLTDANRIRATVNNMTVAGDYVFQVVAFDGKDYSEPLLHTVRVWPENLNAPYINDIIINVKGGVVHLSADAGDVDGDITTYWWSLVSGPAGGEVFFGNDGWDQASLDPVVWASIAGEYTLRLTAIDRTKFTEKDIVVTLTTVPEPAALSALAIGAIALLARRRRA